jgi:hypothetical protein
MRMRSPWLALAALLAVGCLSETRLQPLPSAPTTRSGAVTAEELGVRLVADGDAWKGSPSHLERLVTPVEVRLENQSGRPLRIQYVHFALVGDSRFQYAALSPFQLREDGPAVGGSGFDVGVGTGRPWGVRPGPFASSYGGGPWGPRGSHAPWYDPLYDPWYDPFHGPYGHGRASEPLPSRDMLRQALPEGTLENGGTLTGFLYFQDVSEREGRVTLQARLVDANTGEQFGTLSIPFDVRS